MKVTVDLLVLYESILEGIVYTDGNNWYSKDERKDMAIDVLRGVISEDELTEFETNLNKKL